MRLSAEIFSADRGSTSVIVRSTEDREVYDTFTFRGAGHRTRASSMVSAVEGFQDARGGRRVTDQPCARCGHLPGHHLAAHGLGRGCGRGVDTSCGA